MIDWIRWRLGNLLIGEWTNDEGVIKKEICEVISLNDTAAYQSHNIIVAGGGETHYYDEFYPIEITHQMLIKMHFVFMGCSFNGNKRYSHITHPFDLIFTNDCIMISFKNNVLTGVPCKYVHQLQNLFFSLIGEEIDIKAPYPKDTI